MERIKNKDTKKKKFSLYKLFNPDGNGKGVKKDDKLPRTFKNFFKIFWMNIGHLFTVNIMCVIGNFPILVFMFGFSGILNTTSSTAASHMFPALYGAMTNSSANPATAALFGVHGVQTTLNVYSLPSKIFMWFGILVIFTFGLVNVGTTYILRNIVKGEPIFIWQDFVYAIKRNFKQGLILGIFDSLFIALFLYDLLFFFTNIHNSFTAVLFVIMLFFALIYFFMRFYMYIIMITFDLSLRKIIKNSFIFALLGLKRNLVAGAGILLAAFLTYYIFCLFIPIGIMIPFVILFSGCAFMAAYAAYPKIKEIMIDPYVDEDAASGDEDSDPIFADYVK